MTNDKDLFSQINDLFEDVSIDQASDLIGRKVSPSADDYEKDLIEKLNKNEFKLNDQLVEEITNNIRKGGEVDVALTKYLEAKFGIKPKGNSYIREELIHETAPQVESEPEPEPKVVEPAKETPVREDYITKLGDELGKVIKQQNNSMRDRWSSHNDPNNKGDIYEKVDALAAQLNLLRTSVMESTMVSGIGQGGDGQTPGSGEVKLSRMDDVVMGDIKPGQSICWDPTYFGPNHGAWVPCDAGGSGGTLSPCGSQDECDDGYLCVDGYCYPDPGPPVSDIPNVKFGIVWSCRRLESAGNLYWGTQSDYVNGVTTNLIASDVISVDYGISNDADDDGKGTWAASGVEDPQGKLVVPFPQTSGQSGANGPEGFYLLDAPCAGTGAGEEGCTAAFGSLFGCVEFAKDNGGDLYWGTADEEQNNVGGLKINTLGKVVELLYSFSECPDEERYGEWTCIYRYNDGTGTIKQASTTPIPGKDGPSFNGFFVRDGECVREPEPPLSNRPIIGFTHECKETALASSPIKWGTKADATNGTGISISQPDTMAKKLIASFANPDEVDNSLFGTWNVIYVPENGVEDNPDTWEAATFEGTSSVVGPEGFFLETDSCASTEPEAPEPGTPVFGVVTGCRERSTAGVIKWGTAVEFENGGGDPCPTLAGNVYAEAFEILFVVSTDTDANGVGNWKVIYRDTLGQIQSTNQPPGSAPQSSPEYGFWIDGDEDTCLDDGGENPGVPDDIKIGLLPGCKELEAPSGYVHWGTKEQYEAGLGTNLNELAAKLYFSWGRNISDDRNGVWNLVYSDVLGQLKSDISTTGTSPTEGFFLSGPCKEGQEGGPEGENGPIFGDTFGCIKAYPSGKLYWGNESSLDLLNGELIDDGVTQIRIIGQNVYENLYGEWTVAYKKGALSNWTFDGPRLGTNPTESYYIVPEGVNAQCLENGLDIERPKPNEPNYGQVIGCYQSGDPSTGTVEVHWANSITDQQNGVSTALTTDEDVRKILAVFTFDEVDDTNRAVWNCLYQRVDNSFGYVTYDGNSGPGGFFLDTDNCEGSEVEVPGGELDKNLVFGKDVGCSKTEVNGEGNLYFSSLFSTLAGEKGDVVDDGADVSEIYFSFTTDPAPLRLKWNCFYNKGGQTTVASYVSKEAVNSWPWGFHIADGTCQEEQIEPEPPAGNGEPVYGIVTGCRNVSDGGELYWGTVDDADGVTNNGYQVTDFDNNPVTDAAKILLVVSFNSDSVRFGTWFCLYEKVDGSIGVAATSGRSPASGYYLVGDCDDNNGLECSDDADCPPGFICVGVGTCVQKPCGDDCGTVEIDGVEVPLECFAGFCYLPCDAGRTCPEGFECLEVAPGKYLCVPGGELPGGGGNGGGEMCDDETPCPEGFICVGGRCVLPPCIDDPDDENYCDPATHICIGGHCYERCDADPEGCPIGFECLEFNGNFICAPGGELPGGGLFPPVYPGGGDCDENTPCPPGYMCVGGVCVLLPCTDSSSCLGDTVCVLGHCYSLCDHVTYPDTGCLPGFVCTEYNGQNICLPGGEFPGGICTIDGFGECDEGYICVGGECIPEPCDERNCGDNAVCYGDICYERCDDTSPRPCKPGYICVELPDGNNVCMPIGGGQVGCSVDDDCEEGYICIDGTCTPAPCDGPTGCPPGFGCFPGSNNCYPLCGDGYPICPDGHICVGIGGGDFICMPIGGGGGNSCETDDDCDDGFECVDGNCVPVSCTPGSCAQGEICWEGICVKLCTDDGDCPEGYECIQIETGQFVCLPVFPGGGEELPGENGDLYIGYLPGCVSTGETGGATLAFGTGDVADPDKVVINNNTKSIVFTFAYDNKTENSSYDPLTGIGDWTCIFTESFGNSTKLNEHTELNAGPSPLKGYYLETDDCELEPPEQPGGDNTVVETTPIGCKAAAPYGTLKWGTAADVLDGTSTDIIDIEVEEIIYTGYTNSFTNGWADQIVIYRKRNVTRGVKVWVEPRQNPIDGIEYGFFLDVVYDNTQRPTTCESTGTEPHGPIRGAFTGCREVDFSGDVYWGTRQDYSDLVDGLTSPQTTNATNLGVVARTLLVVVSPDCDDDGLGNWDIHYITPAGATEVVTTYGRSGADGPEGAFILPGDGSTCITDEGSLLKIYTDDVILRAIEDINNAVADIKGTRGAKHTDTFDHQDNANKFYLEEFQELNDRKPTMITAKFTGDDSNEPDYTVTGVPDQYLPMTGDLWLDPNPDALGRENILRAAIAQRPPGRPRYLEHNYPTEWVVVSGDGEGGGPGGPVTTDNVLLINTVKFYEKYNKILNLSPEEFAAAFPLVTQEDANLLNADMLSTLHELKPTIHITPEIYGVVNYRPKRGDIWVDPTDYSMYVCDINDINNPPNLIINPSDGFPYEDESGNYLYWVEIGGSGGGTGNRVFIQLEPPTMAIEGDLWVDQADYYVHVFSPEGSWVALTGDQSAMGKQFKVWVDVEPPIDPRTWTEGDLWFDTEDSEMRIWLNTENGGNGNWIPISNGGVDRRKAIYEQSLRDLNEKYQMLASRLASLEGNASETTDNFTAPLTSVETLEDAPGTVDPRQNFGY